MNIAIFCGVFAGVVQVVGYWIYNKDVFTDPQRKPNAASWGLWAFGSLLTSSSYAEVAHDWVKEILPFACVTACTLTFLAFLIKGKLGRPDKRELAILILDLLILVFWVVSESARYANLLLMGSVVISFIPNLRSVWNKPTTENPIPWFVWSFAYALLFVTVILRFEKWWDLAYPVTYFILHIAVGLIAKFRTANV